MGEQNVQNAEKLLKNYSNKISTSVNHNNNQNNGISSNKQRLDLINPRRKISSEVHQLASYRSKNNNFNAISHFNPNCSNNISIKRSKTFRMETQLTDGLKQAQIEQLDQKIRNLRQSRTI